MDYFDSVGPHNVGIELGSKGFSPFEGTPGMESPNSFLYAQQQLDDMKSRWPEYYKERYGDMDVEGEKRPQNGYIQTGGAGIYFPNYF